MNTYFKYADSNQVDCYLELNDEFYCERAVFISTIFEPDSNVYYYEGEEYQMPDECLEKEIESMTAIRKTEFEIQWGKKYTGNDEVKFLLKHTILQRSS